MTPDPNVALECPHCFADLPTTVEQFRSGIPLSCQACGRQTDTSTYVATYELMLRWPEVFLERPAQPQVDG